MSDNKTNSKTQRIIVNPASSSVSVINAGPIGPGGVKGETGSDGAQGIQGETGSDGAQGIQGIPGPAVNINSIFTEDGQLLTRINGIVSPITRQALSLDTVFASPISLEATTRALNDTTEVNARVAADTDLKNSLARGIIAWKMGTANPVINPTPLALYSISANLVSGRMYELIFTCRAISTSNFVHFTHNCNPSIPGFIIDVYVYCPTSYNEANWNCLLHPISTQNYTININVNTGASSGNIWTDNGSGIWIKDIGLAVPSS